MLKQTVIVLFTLVVYGAQARFTPLQDTASVETVAIKVTVVPRVDISELETQPRPETKKKLRARKLVPQSQNTTPRISQSSQTPQLQVNSSSEDNLQPKPLNTDAGIREDVRKVPESFALKRVYFLSGLLLLIAGIIITLFFRTGASLMTGIILIISGFYILLYSLLFWE